MLRRQEPRRRMLAPNCVVTRTAAASPTGSRTLRQQDPRRSSCTLTQSRIGTRRLLAPSRKDATTTREAGEAGQPDAKSEPLRQVLTLNVPHSPTLSRTGWRRLRLRQEAGGETTTLTTADPGCTQAGLRHQEFQSPKPYPDPFASLCMPFPMAKTIFRSPAVIFRLLLLLDFVVFSPRLKMLKVLT